MYRIRDIFSRVDARVRRLDFRYVPPESMGCGNQCGTIDHADSRLWLRSFFDSVSDVWKPDPLDEAIDLGCGKAGAVSVLARYFTRVDGIDISPTLIAIGRENLRRMRVRNASLMAGDAGQYRNLDRYKFVYMFNPFPREVMLKVAANFKRIAAARTAADDRAVSQTAGYRPFRRLRFSQNGRGLPAQC